MAASLAEALEINVSSVSVTVVQASLLIIFEVAARNASDASDMAARLASQIPTSEQATDLLTTRLPADVAATITVLAVPAIDTEVRRPLSPSVPPPTQRETAPTDTTMALDSGDDGSSSLVVTIATTVGALVLFVILCFRTSACRKSTHLDVEVSHAEVKAKVGVASADAEHDLHVEGTLSQIRSMR